MEAQVAALPYHTSTPSILGKCTPMGGWGLVEKMELLGQCIPKTTVLQMHRKL